jgi:DinB family protein
MNAKDAIRYSLNSNAHILKTYLSDLSDSDLLTRPAPNANHPAWQLGHLIAAEVSLVASMGCKTAPLPPGFAEKYTKQTAGNDSPSAFLKKQEYIDLFDKVRAGTQAALEVMPDADLDKPTIGNLKDFAPTNGAMFLLVANHVTMHAGQFVPLRRQLGKPVLI